MSHPDDSKIVKMTLDVAAESATDVAFIATLLTDGGRGLAAFHNGPDILHYIIDTYIGSGGVDDGELYDLRKTLRDTLGNVEQTIKLYEEELKEDSE